MSHLHHRGISLPHAVHGEGVWIVDSEGRRYLDAASGALVVNVGHGDPVVIAALSDQARQVSYVHPTTFTTAAVERYADELSAVLPLDDATVYPVSGGSEAVETALKVARTYHLARGQEDRSVVIGRELSYHGNTRGALDVSSRASLQSPYGPWLGLAGRVPAVLEYRCPNPGHPQECGLWHAEQLESEIQRVGPDRVAAFIAEPIGGATSGAAVPPHDYWQQTQEVCRRYDVLIIADEVMCGFGRTGRWFASEHFGLKPDIMTMAKGASSGYWPLGVCAFTARVRDVIDSDSGLVHGFTFSHHAVGAAVGLAVLRRIEELGLVSRAEQRGSQLITELHTALSTHPNVGDIRGMGLMVAIELVEDRDTRKPFPRERRIVEEVLAAARNMGLLLYPSTGCADGIDGDAVVIGPPLVVDQYEVALLVELTSSTLTRVLR